MNLSAPTMPVFVIAVVLAALAVIGQLTPVAFVSGNGFWLAIAAFVVLAIGNIAKGV